MALTIATWNINSVRLRAGLVAEFLEREAPDVLCLQETKTPAAKFPHERFAALGYRHLRVRGDKGYNGVAIVSRLPLGDAEHGDAEIGDAEIGDADYVDFCGRGDARHIAAVLPGGVALHNFYVPAGGDEPDPEANPKFAHKLQFVAEMAEWGAALEGPAILTGDLNIAPLEADVWSHRQLLNVISHTPVEVEALGRAQAAGGWRDVTRAHIPPPERVYSWWSYRARDWAASDRGRRPPLAARRRPRPARLEPGAARLARRRETLGPRAGAGELRPLRPRAISSKAGSLCDSEIAAPQ